MSDARELEKQILPRYRLQKNSIFAHSPVVLLSERKDYMDHPKNKQIKGETLPFFFAKLCPQYFFRLCFKVRFLWKQTPKWELCIKEVNQEGTSKSTPVGEKEKLLSGKRETEWFDSVPTKALVANIGSSESEWSLRQVWYKASLQSCMI